MTEQERAYNAGYKAGLEEKRRAEELAEWEEETISYYAKDGSRVMEYRCTCSNCKRDYFNGSARYWKYCPSCGARMREEGKAYGYRRSDKRIKNTICWRV